MAVSATKSRFRTVKIVALTMVLALALLLFANWRTAPTDLGALYLTHLHASLDMDRVAAEVSQSTMRVAARPGFLASVPEAHKGRIMRELHEKAPGFAVWSAEEEYAFHDEFRTVGIPVDTIVLTGDVTTRLGVPRVRCGYVLYGTMGRGCGNGHERSYWWVGFALCSQWHSDAHGQARAGISHRPYYRLLPSNPDCVPVGQRAR